MKDNFYRGLPGEGHDLFCGISRQTRGDSDSRETANGFVFASTARLKSRRYDPRVTRIFLSLIRSLRCQVIFHCKYSQDYALKLLNFSSINPNHRISRSVVRQGCVHKIRYFRSTLNDPRDWAINKICERCATASLLSFSLAPFCLRSSKICGFIESRVARTSRNPSVYFASRKREQKENAKWQWREEEETAYVHAHAL